MILLNGVMAFYLNYCNFMTNKKTSALTITVAGNVKHVLTILISVMIFQNPISYLNIIGTIVTIFGAIIYSYVDYTKHHSHR
jgi:uncharacterized membrane protein